MPNIDGDTASKPKSYLDQFEVFFHSVARGLTPINVSASDAREYWERIFLDVTENGNVDPVTINLQESQNYRDVAMWVRGWGDRNFYGEK